MAVNPYSELTKRLVTTLSTNLPVAYTPLLVVREVFNPQQLPAGFVKWLIIVSPPQRPWDERRHATASINYDMRVDLYLLVRTYDDARSGLSLWGTDADADRGLFQFIDDVKTLLRRDNLGGYLMKTYDEPGGDASKQGAGGLDFALPGFDASGKFPLAHRAKIPYRAQLQPFCHERN